MATMPNQPVITPARPPKQGKPDMETLYDGSLSFTTYDPNGDGEPITETLNVTVVATLWGSSMIDFRIDVTSDVDILATESKTLTIRSEYPHIEEWD